jgi:hypothetical protein
MISQFFIRFRAAIRPAGMIMPVSFDCGFEFEKGRQLLICMHNKASSVARSAATTQIGRPLPSVVAIEPQFHPALRRFLMMISQYHSAESIPHPRASQPLPHFPERASAHARDLIFLGDSYAVQFERDF